MWMVKNIFPGSLTKKESWLVFGLCYIPVTFCLIYSTMKGDGGKETPQEQQMPKIIKSTNVSKISGRGELAFFAGFFATDVYAAEPGPQGRVANAPSYCGVTPNTYTIYLTFNSDQPYFITPGQTRLRVVLLDLNTDKNSANIEINDNGNPINGPKKFLAQLSQNQTSDFQYKDCKFRITYMGYGSFREGLFLLFRTRYFANVKVEKL